MLRILLRTVARVVFVSIVITVLLLSGLKLTNPSPQTDSFDWRVLTAMPSQRGEVAAATLDGKLYVSGGLRGLGTTTDVVDVYDIERDQWSDWPTLPARHHAAAAAALDRVFISGGASSATDWKPSPEVYAIHAPTGTSLFTSMPEGRQGHAMVGLGGKLYVIGGVGETDDTLIYDIKENKWSRAAPLPEGRDHLRALFWNGKIWAIGGRSNGKVLTRVDLFDGTRWTPGPQLPEPMSAMAVGVLSDGLHVIGGEDPSLVGSVSDKRFVLNEGASAWRGGSKPPLPVHGAGFGVHDGKLYIAGGASRQGALSAISWTDVTQMLDPDL